MSILGPKTSTKGAVLTLLAVMLLSISPTKYAQSATQNEKKNFLDKFNSQPAQPISQKDIQKKKAFLDTLGYSGQTSKTENKVSAKSSKKTFKNFKKSNKKGKKISHKNIKKSKSPVQK